jgi:hypothetical protein
MTFSMQQYPVGNVVDWPTVPNEDDVVEVGIRESVDWFLARGILTDAPRMQPYRPLLRPREIIG